MGQQEAQRPFDPYHDDLNPNDHAGDNSTGDPQETFLSAYEFKDLHDHLRQFPDDVLKRIPFDAGHAPGGGGDLSGPARS